MSERVVPHNTEAERSVLGGVIVDNRTSDQAGSVVTSAMFFRAAHRKIFTAIQSLASRDQAVDLVTLKNELDTTGDLEDVGGPAYISALVDGVPRSTNVKYYAEIVREKYRLRELIKAGTATVDAAYTGESTSGDVLRQSEQRLFDLSAHRGESRMMDLRHGVTALASDLEFRVANKGQVTGLPTGFASIDDLTLGWQAGDLIIIAARTSIGKSTFAVNSAVAVAQSGKRVAIFSLEMTREQIEYRILSALSGIPLTQMKVGNVSDFEMAQKIAPAMQVMHDLPIEIDDTPGRTAWDIRRQCRQMHAEGGLGLAVVDFVQLLTPTEQEQDLRRDQQIGQSAQTLKVTAKELSIAVHLLSQVKRGEEGQAPQLSDLRESGNLEEYADVVMFLHRKNSLDSGKTEAMFKKMRDGNGGTLKLTLEREYVRFLDGCTEPEPTEGPERKPRQKAFKSDRW